MRQVTPFSGNAGGPGSCRVFMSQAGGRNGRLADAHGDLSAGIGEVLPNLGQGEFLTVCDALLMPTVGRFALPVPEPHSRSVNYLQEWKADWREVNFADVIERWRGKALVVND